jgi:septum formation protein
MSASIKKSKRGQEKLSSVKRMKTLVLASGSPRRKELLAKAGYAFLVDPSSFDEEGIDPSSMPPHELARFLSLQKALDVSSRHPDSVVLAADTFIVLDGEIMGKPHTPEEATRMLRTLSGRTHSVITGYSFVLGQRHFSDSVESRVTFRDLSDDDIEEYVRTGEPLDKAGAYAIQGKGAALVENLEGSLDNVIGLPLDEVSRSLSCYIK